MLTAEEARIRVSKGAAHLDVVRPGWFHQVDSGTLTLHDPCGCVVGQLCGMGWAFERALRALGGPNGTGVLRWAGDHGFNLVGCNVEPDHQMTMDAYVLLQDAWIAEIAARRHPVAEPVIEAESTPVILDHEPSHAVL